MTSSNGRSSWSLHLLIPPHHMALELELAAFRANPFYRLLEYRRIIHKAPLRLVVCGASIRIAAVKAPPVMSVDGNLDRMKGLKNRNLASSPLTERNSTPCMHHFLPGSLVSDAQPRSPPAGSDAPHCSCPVEMIDQTEMRSMVPSVYIEPCKRSP